MLLPKGKFQLLQQMFRVPFRPSNEKYDSEENELIKFSNHLSKNLYNNSSTILSPSQKKSSLKDVINDDKEKKSSFPSYDFSNINSNINYSIDDIRSPQIYYNLSKEIIIENPEEVIQSGCLNGSLNKQTTTYKSTIYEDLNQEINYNLVKTPNINYNVNLNTNTNINNFENQINNADLEANNEQEKSNNLTVSKLIPGDGTKTVKIDNIPNDQISAAEENPIEENKNEDLNQKEEEPVVEDVPIVAAKKYQITKTGNVVVIPDNYSTDDEDEYKAINTLSEDLSTWQKKLDENGIKIYFRPFPTKDDKGKDSESVLCFVDLILDFPATTVISKLNDFCFRQKMDEFYEKGKLINEKVIDGNIKVSELYLYMKMPFIFSDRDFVVQRKCWLDHNGNKDHALFYLHSIENPDFPAKEKPLRANFEYKSMYIKPLGPNQCKLNNVTAMDLKLSVGVSTLMKSGQEKQEKWIKNLKKELKK